MVETASELGSFYRSDRKGFGYKSAYLYFNSASLPNAEAHNYLITEDLSGKWSLICLFHPTHYNEGCYNEFINRKKIIKGLRSEKDVIDYFRNVPGGQDLMDKDIFVRIDPEVPIKD